MKKKIAIMLVAVVLVIGCVVGGTLAWLTAETPSVENTFTVGDINIRLEEHDYLPETNTLDQNNVVESNDDYKFVPGVDLPKDPFVTVEAGSEPCYVFLGHYAENWSVPLDDSNAPKIHYSIDESVWNSFVDSNSGARIYYCEVDALESDQTLNVLADKKVTVSPELTKAELEALGKLDGDIKLGFYAMAIQKEGFNSVQAAWAELNK